MLSYWEKIWDKKATRFLVVGTFNTLLDFILLNILFQVVGLPLLLANSISVTVAVTGSYILNHKIVFRQQGGLTLKGYGHFLLITGFSVLVIQNIVIFTAKHLFVVPEDRYIEILNHSVSERVLELNLAKVVAVLIGMVWNFLLYKYVVFKNPKPTQEADKVLIV